MRPSVTWTPPFRQGRGIGHKFIGVRDSVRARGRSSGQGRAPDRRAKSLPLIEAPGMSAATIDPIRLPLPSQPSRVGPQRQALPLKTERRRDGTWSAAAEAQATLDAPDALRQERFSPDPIPMASIIARAAALSKPATRKFYIVSTHQVGCTCRWERGWPETEVPRRCDRRLAGRCWGL
jgi:hypothetical protein